MIRYIGQCADYNNTHTYKVVFYINSSVDYDYEIQLSENDPIIIKQNSDELYSPIKTQSATINIVTPDYLMDLYNVDFSVRCIVFEDDFNLIFHGYVTPNIYTQDYNNVSTITIEAISGLGRSKYRNYETIGTEPGIYTVAEILAQIIDFESYYWFIRYCGDRIGIEDYIYNYGLDYIYLDERNFFDDNEEKTPWKEYDVIEEICRILGVSIIETEGFQLYMIKYNSNILNTYTQATYDLVGGNRSNTQVTIGSYVLDTDLFNSSNNSISMEETYHKIEVKANTYPYEDVINKLLSSDYWQLADVYQGNSLSDIQYSPYAPYLKYTRNDGKTFSIYYLYYKTNTMSPHQYFMRLNNGQYGGVIDDLAHPNDWIYTLINQPNAAYPITSSTQIGAALMKMASYDISDLKLVNSLQWNEQIVLYMGMNNLNINSYHTSGRTWPQAWQALKEDICDTYLLNNFYSYDYSSVNDFIPNKYLLKIESEADVIIKNDSYLVISGKMGLYDCEYEDSQKDDWAGSDRFNRPNAYVLIDQEQTNTYIPYLDIWKQENNRKYIGFNFLDIQIRIGNKICCEAKYYDSNISQWVIQYKWMTKQEYYDYYWDTEREQFWSLNPHLQIPVGEDKFSFYKLYDITNTCDWRLGLDGASGFAIPLPKDADLSGKLQIYIVAPSIDLYGLYLDGYSDFNSLPTTSFNVIHNPNPGNMWNYNGTWTIMDYELDIHGTYPNNIIIQNLSFDIKNVQFHTISDTAKSNANNKNTDHVYSNINTGNLLDDTKSLECKINTQDEAKNRSFSSLLRKDSDNKYQYIQKMWSGKYNQGGYEIYQTQENNVIDLLKDHYFNKKLIFDTELIGCEYKPNDIIWWDLMQKNMVIDSMEKHLHENYTNMKLVEI